QPVIFLAMRPSRLNRLRFSVQAQAILKSPLTHNVWMPVPQARARLSCAARCVNSEPMQAVRARSTHMISIARKRTLKPAVPDQSGGASKRISTPTPAAAEASDSVETPPSLLPTPAAADPLRNRVNRILKKEARKGLFFWV